MLTAQYALGPLGCIICCAQQNEPAPRFQSVDECVHRHMSAAALLERTRCVVGRVALDQEGFDINT